VTKRRLPETPKELFRLSVLDRIIFNGLILLFRVTGLWRYPPRRHGDLERWGFLDKVYWLYKATRPERRARRNSGLEEYFAKQEPLNWQIPENLSGRKELTVSAVGDLMNHPYLLNSKDTLYREIAEHIFGADLPMANLECPIVANAKKKFVFSFNPPPPLFYDPAVFAVVKDYKKQKYAFMATACNHSLDFGLSGAISTIDHLRAEGIAQNGINVDEQDAHKATIIEKNGFRIAVIAYTLGLNSYSPPENCPWLVNRMKLNDGPENNDFTQLIRQIDYCKDSDVDFTFAHLHWGMEHELYPTPEQVAFAHHIIELGIDAIIGHHPHVLQPMEFYRTRRDPNRMAPIYYSLGNLINFFSADFLCRSGVANISLVKGSLPDGTEKVYVKTARLREVIQKADEANEVVRLLPA
jgi:hypothetical protein